MDSQTLDTEIQGLPFFFYGWSTYVLDVHVRAMCGFLKIINLIDIFMLYLTVKNNGSTRLNENQRLDVRSVCRVPCDDVGAFIGSLVDV